MGEVVREFEAPVDGHFVVRVYAHASGGMWRAWLEFASLEHGDLSRSGIVHVAADRDGIVRWATRLGTDEVHRALEDAELVRAGELGRPPAEGAALG